MMTEKDLTVSGATFYDHAVNAADAAQGSAIARARRDAIDRRVDFTVICCWPGGEPFWWNGCHYDALGLARSIRSNGGLVVMQRRDGSQVDIDADRY
jgi:hypothetical protein